MKGDSGRVVIEIDPSLKRRFYTALMAENSTMKEWFVEAAKQYVAEHEEPRLPDIANKKHRARKP
ncbi:MAG: hypothetical protein POH28_14115 [Acidocella sp.]|nr:hypothetical protein [Acidocella sp.]